MVWAASRKFLGKCLSRYSCAVGDWVSPFKGGIVYQGGSRSGSSSLEGGASGSGEDDEEDDASEQEDGPVDTDAPPVPAEDGLSLSCSEDSAPEFSSDGGPEPIHVDDDDYIDGEVYAAAESFAGEMHTATTPAPEAQKIYVPPLSLYVKQLFCCLIKTRFMLPIATRRSMWLITLAVPTSSSQPWVSS